MRYLKEDDVVPGNVIPITLSGTFEGYAELIEPVNEGTTLLNGKRGGSVNVRQRWLIEWVQPDKVDPKDMNSDYFNQRMLAGKRTHRNVEFRKYRSWKEYWYSEGRFKTEE